MDDKQRIDTAAEPVDTQDDEFMDTGVLHEHPKVRARREAAEREQAEGGESPGD